VHPAPSNSPTLTKERISNLDAIRGVAVLGILVMNAVSYGLPRAAYFNLSAAGWNSLADKVVGVAGEILVDQKMMGLFSLLFGAGIVLFADRAQARGTRANPLILWRNVLLLGIGLVHTMMWEGDVLTVYAICAPVLVILRRVRPSILLVLGTVTVLSSAVVALIVQLTIPLDGTGLGDYWFPNGGAMSGSVGFFLLNDFFARALGMMLIGVALYRLGLLNGTREPSLYRTWIRWGMGIGIPLATIGVAAQIATGFSPRVAIVGEAPNTLATIPVAMAYLGLISLWNRRGEGWMHRRVRAAGRMALTNYLTQTLAGVLVLRGLLGAGGRSRAHIALFVAAVWAVQLAWSEPWLRHFRFGPVEWLWRSATYRSVQPLRMRKPGSSPALSG